MIQTVVNSLLSELNSNLKRRFSLQDKPKIVLSPLVDVEGNLAIDGEKNKLVMTLVDIEETRFKGHSLAKSDIQGRQKTAFFRPPIHLNLYILISAYFDSSNMDEAYMYISEVLSFFQKKAIFDPKNTPSLGNTNIDKLYIELYNQSFQDKSHMWSMIGAKYLPSVLYKIKMLTIQEDEVLKEVPDIKASDSAPRS